MSMLYRILLFLSNTNIKKPKLSNLNDAHFEWIANTPQPPQESQPIFDNQQSLKNCLSPNFEYAYASQYKMLILDLECLEENMNNSNWEGFYRNSKKRTFDEFYTEYEESSYDYDHRIVKPYEWSNLQNIEPAKDIELHCQEKIL